MFQTYSKYGNKKTLYDNISFSSRKEAKRYGELKLLVRSGKITNLVLQPQFVLQEKFTDSKGVKHRAIVYIADFSYIEQSKAVVEDVKSSPTFQTEIYKLKKKLLLFKYPLIDFKEIY